uniref:Uncharacterized protein n=1 Tax=Rhizophagus irregularis (strain DAOM 181602 / DAOM 197198 / MUCL 43194) TaxID=747089 RepID=U9TE80_RHIID
MGTCYSCQKCLYCNSNLAIDNCSCNKTIKPTNNDDEESISEENEITPPSKQKKKTSVPKESNLDEIDLMKGEIHKKFKEKHGCNIHKTGYCYIKDDRHLPLTTLHLSMWTNEIYKNHCDYETPPPRPNFGRENSLKVPSSNQSSTASAKFLEELDKQYGEDKQHTTCNLFSCYSKMFECSP